MSSSQRMWVNEQRESWLPCLGEESHAPSTSLIIYTNLKPAVTGTETFCLPRYTSPRTFLQIADLKHPLISLWLWYMTTERTKIQGSAAQCQWFQFLYGTQRRAANPQPSTARSDFLMTSPFYCQETATAQTVQNWGWGRDLTSFILLPHQTREVSETRGSVTPLITFWCSIALFEASTLRLCSLKLLHNEFWGVLNSTGHSYGLEGFTQKKKQIKMQGKRHNTEAVLFPGVTSQKY